MGYHAVKNNALTTLASAINNSQTTITVVSDISPSSLPFYLTIGQNPASGEIIEVIEKSGNIYTVNRGISGTTKQSFAEGTKVQMLLIAEHIEEIHDGLMEVDNKISQAVSEANQYTDEQIQDIVENINDLVDVVSSTVSVTYKTRVVLNEDSMEVPFSVPQYVKAKDTIWVYLNGTVLYPDDYIASDDPMKITSTGEPWSAGDDFLIVVEGTSSTEVADALTTTVLTNTYIATGGETNVPIGIEHYNKDTDFLEPLFKNIILLKDINFTLNPDGKSIDLINWTLESGDKVYFRVWKKVRESFAYFDGIQLVEGSVKKKALSRDVIDYLDDSIPLNFDSEFDEDGRITKVIETFADTGKKYRETEYSDFNDNDMPQTVVEKWYDENEEISKTNTTICTYNENGILVMARTVRT